MEFCAKVDFDLLTGKTFKKNNYGCFDKTEHGSISLKFSKIEMKTQNAIAIKRVQHLEMNRRRKNHKLSEEGDHRILLL